LAGGISGLGTVSVRVQNSSGSGRGSWLDEPTHLGTLVSTDGIGWGGGFGPSEWDRVRGLGGWDRGECEPEQY